MLLLSDRFASSSICASFQAIKSGLLWPTNSYTVIPLCTLFDLEHFSNHSRQLTKVSVDVAYTVYKISAIRLSDTTGFPGLQDRRPGGQRPRLTLDSCLMLMPALLLVGSASKKSVRSVLVTGTVSSSWGWFPNQ